jgi:hypothetical protein
MVISVWIRPTEYPGVFNIMLGGKDVDIDALLANSQAIFDLVLEVTKRDNLEFGEIIWKTDWKANVRMAEHFGKGRVFLIGGMCLQFALLSLY